MLPLLAWLDAVGCFIWIGFGNIAPMHGVCTLSDLSLVLVIAFAGQSLFAPQRVSKSSFVDEDEGPTMP